MMKHRKRITFFAVLKTAGWLLANLALCLFLWCILAYCAFQWSHIKQYEYMAVAASFVYTAPLGIPLGVFLLHVVFYKLTKRDWKIILLMFFMCIAIPAAGFIMNSGVIIAFSPVFVIVDAILSCICLLSQKRVSRFRAGYSWSSKNETQQYDKPSIQHSKRHAAYTCPKRQTGFLVNGIYLFVSIFAGFALWMILLLTMYFISDASGYELIGMMFLTAIIGIPLGIFLMQLIFMKATKHGKRPF